MLHLFIFNQNRSATLQQTSSPILFDPPLSLLRGKGRCGGDPPLPSPFLIPSFASAVFGRVIEIIFSSLFILPSCMPTLHPLNKEDTQPFSPDTIQFFYTILFARWIRFLGINATIMLCSRSHHITRPLPRGIRVQPTWGPLQILQTRTSRVPPMPSFSTSDPCWHY